MELLRPGAPVRHWLGWAAALYGLGLRACSWWRRLGGHSPVRLPCRVISVGNLTVGGTGKTPVVILLVGWLLAEGRRVAVLSRGYKRSSPMPSLLVSDGQRILAGPADAGDEPVLIARRCPGAVVAVGTDRAALGRWVLEQYPVDCIVLDDGFQHVALHRDVNLVLIDATDATGLDALLPAGRLREPLAGLARAGEVLITRADSRAHVESIRNRIAGIRGAPSAEAEVIFRPEALVSLIGDRRYDVERCRGQHAWLVSGIANSRSFRGSVEATGLSVLGETVFRDHHRYCPDDVQRVRTQAGRANAALVVTTEKDAVKLSPLVTASDPWWALRLRAEVVRGEEQLRRLIVGKGQAARDEA